MNFAQTKMEVSVYKGYIKRKACMMFNMYDAICKQ